MGWKKHIYVFFYPAAYFFFILFNGLFLFFLAPNLVKGLEKKKKLKQQTMAKEKKNKRGSSKSNIEYKVTTLSRKL
jgi:hypothetical protein